MSDNIRIKTTPGGGETLVNLQVNQKFDFIEILSLKISQDEAYRRFCSDYGVVVGRVTVNNGLGVPNAKVSIFIPVDEVDIEDTEVLGMYPYKEINTKDSKGIAYNLLPRNNRGKDNCFTPIGTFPSKREIQDNPLLGEVYCKYYKFTTTTNNSGDFMIFGLPVGTHFMHINADISDIGILSQRPYDLIREGAAEKSFKSSTKFKGRKESSVLSQLKTTSPISVTVPPFWGDTTQCNIGIARSDVDLATDIKSTAIFMGSIISDNDKHALSRGCRPRKKLGKMDEIVTGDGRIEMIRKTLDDGIERFDVEGGEVIDEDGAWAYQIPMNRDYKITSEDGTLVPSGDPSKGIATSARVRFRIGMMIDGDEGRLRTRAKYLVPHNPSSWNKSDFTFGTSTQDDNFTDLSWNNIYTVKNHITRVQPNRAVENRNFIGLKNVDDSGTRNPFPFNKLDNDTNPLFIVLCIIMSIIARLVGTLNLVLIPLLNIVISLLNAVLFTICLVIKGIGLLICAFPDWLVGSGCEKKFCIGNNRDTISKIKDCSCKNILDPIPFLTLPCQGVDYVPGGIKEIFGAETGGYKGLKNDASKNPKGGRFPSDTTDYKCTVIRQLTIEGCDAGWTDCQAIVLADALDVFKLDFYNDWINGTLYAFLLKYKKKRNGKEKFCEVDCKDFGTSANPGSDNNCRNNFIVDSCTNAAPQSKDDNTILVGQTGVGSKRVIKIKSGYIKNYENELYYPPVATNSNYKLFATDIVNLGSIFDCSWNGDQKFYQFLTDTTSKIPPLVNEIDDNNNTLTTGFKLFGEINCLGLITDSDNCNNLKRVCELGVGLDERKDGTPPNKKIDNTDINNPFVRTIFTKLNLSPSVIPYPLPEVLFDNPSYPDYQDTYYKQFRNNKTSDHIWVYDNSYYFYFGLNKGKTALSKMKSKYFTQCVPELDVDFYIVTKTIKTNDATATATGAISINIIGGVGPYTFTWSQVTVGTGTAAISYPTITTTQDISDLVAGVYNVEVVDSLGNIANGSFTVPGPTPVSCNVQSTNVTSFGAKDGTISVNVNGGSPDYKYELFDYDTTSSATVGAAIATKTTSDPTWTGPLTSYIFDNSLVLIGPGDYMVRVTDGTLPTATSCDSIVTITEDPLLSIVLNGTNSKCFGDESGEIIATVNGGVPPYTYEWISTTNAYDATSNTSGFKPVYNVSTLSKTPGGTYELKVTDKNGLGTTKSQTETITEPAKITFDKEVTIGCNGASTGKLEIKNIAGGTGHYKIEIESNGFIQDKQLFGGVNHTFTNLVEGVDSNQYEITVSDANSCESFDSVNVLSPATKLNATLTVDKSTSVDASSSVRTFVVSINGGIYQDNAALGTVYGYKLQIQRKTGSTPWGNYKSEVDVPIKTHTFTENYSSLPLAPNPNPASPGGTPVSVTTTNYEYRVVVYDKDKEPDGCIKESNITTVNVKTTP